MRRFSPRPTISEALEKKLAEKTAEILAHSNPPSRAEDVFNNSRGTLWFSPIVETLANLSGLGQRCMFCSGSESSQVEHFRPKASYPEFSMSWSNFLWACSVCNLNKGNRFPTTTSGGFILNPLDDNVWNHCFIDEFGNLTARWDVAINDVDQRALLTIAELGLDRETLQETRQCRIRNLHELIGGANNEYLAGSITRDELRERIDFWISEPYQPDVADYFLRGPGKTVIPFRTVLEMADLY